MLKRIFDRSKFKVTRDISPTISGWILVLYVSYVLHVIHICALVGMTLVDHVGHTKTHSVLARMEMFHHFQMTLSG